MVKRELDNVFFRIERNGVFENICFTDATPEEQEELLKNRSPEWLSQLCLHLANQLRKLGDEFHVVGVKIGER